MKPVLDDPKFVNRDDVVMEHSINIGEQTLQDGTYMISQKGHIILSSNTTLRNNHGANGVPGYDCPNQYRTPAILYSWQEAVCIVRLGRHSPDVNLDRNWKQCGSRIIRQNYCLLFFRSPDFMVSAPRFFSLQIFASLMSGFGVEAFPKNSCLQSFLLIVLVLTCFVRPRINLAVLQFTSLFMCN